MKITSTGIIPDKRQELRAHYTAFRLSPLLPQLPASPSQTHIKMSPSLPALPLTEVRKHRTAADAWLVVGPTIYDVSTFAGVHPGGAEILLSCAGSDATREFREVGHSADAEATMAPLAVGTLRDATPGEARAAKREDEEGVEGGGEGGVGEQIEMAKALFGGVGMSRLVFVGIGAVVVVAFLVRRTVVAK